MAGRQSVTPAHLLKVGSQWAQAVAGTAEAKAKASAIDMLRNDRADHFYRNEPDTSAESQPENQNVDIAISDPWSLIIPTQEPASDSSALAQFHNDMMIAENAVQYEAWRDPSGHLEIWRPGTPRGAIGIVTAQRNHW